MLFKFHSRITYKRGEINIYSESDNAINKVEILEGSPKPVEIKISMCQTAESKEIARQRGLPSFDVLHAILARDNHAVLVTRDRHFCELGDIAESAPPERIIFD